MRRAAILAALLALWPVQGAANPVKSEYTTIDLKTCKKTEPMQPGEEAWTCPGLPGYPVYVASKGTRTYVSVGSSPERRRAAGQTLAAANTIFANGARRTTLEWRFDRKENGLVPYATILRYFTRSGAGQGEVIVVSRVTPAQSCHVAYIDALATREPIVLAHRIADQTARTFDCNKAPVMAGTTGRSPM